MKKILLITLSLLLSIFFISIDLFYTGYDLLIDFLLLTSSCFMGICIFYKAQTKKDPLNMNKLEEELEKDKIKQLEEKIKTLESALEKALS